MGNGECGKVKEYGGGGRAKRAGMVGKYTTNVYSMAESENFLFLSATRQIYPERKKKL